MGHEQIADITWASQQVNIKQTYKVIFGIKVPSCLNLSQIIQATEIEGAIKSSLPSTQCRSELFKSGGANSNITTASFIVYTWSPQKLCWAGTL